MLGARALSRLVGRTPSRGARRRGLSEKKKAPAEDRASSSSLSSSSSSAEEDVFDAAALWNLVKFGAFLHCLHEYVVEVSMCCGPSMLPTFNITGDIILMDRISPRLGRVKVGDIVICKSPTHPHQTVCKRIAALGGGAVPSFPAATVPAGHAWLLGDNPDNSTDSRVYGPVSTKMIKGRVVCRIFPFDQATFY